MTVLRELSTFDTLRARSAVSLLLQAHVQLINCVQRQAHKFMLILPLHVPLFELFSFRRMRRRLGNLGDEIRGRGFCNTVDEDSEERDFEKDKEGDCEAVEDTLTIAEPLALLVGGVANAGEVWFELAMV